MPNNFKVEVKSDPILKVEAESNLISNIFSEPKEDSENNDLKNQESDVWKED